MVSPLNMLSPIAEESEPPSCNHALDHPGRGYNNQISFGSEVISDIVTARPVSNSSVDTGTFRFAPPVLAFKMRSEPVRHQGLSQLKSNQSPNGESINVNMSKLLRIVRTQSPQVVSERAEFSI
jgi:hypothetical protein